MDFELRRAREKLEKEQKERKEKARLKLERERKAKLEAFRQQEAIEAARRTRRIDAAEAQLKADEQMQESLIAGKGIVFHRFLTPVLYEGSGDKIKLPLSCFKELSDQGAFDKGPLYFRLSVVQQNSPSDPNPNGEDTQRSTHSGVLEFTVDEDCVALPRHVWNNLFPTAAIAAPLVEVRYVWLPKGVYAKLQPDRIGFSDIPNHKAVLETILRHHATLSENDLLTVNHGILTYTLRVLELRPSSSVSVLETDIEVDVVSPDKTSITADQPYLQPLELGKSESGALDEGNYVYYKFSINGDVWSIIESGDANVCVKMETGENDGDTDLYVSRHPLLFPTTHQHQWSSHDVGSKTLTMTAMDENLGAGSYTVGVYGFKGTSKYKLTVTVEAAASQKVGLKATSTSQAAEVDTVECRNCKHLIPSRSITLHEAYCSRNNVTCKRPGCGVVLRVGEAKNHVHCEKCGKAFQQAEMEKHMKVFHEPLQCPCGVLLEKEDMVQHQAADCPLRLITCRFCGDMVQAGNSAIDVRDRMRGLSEHESGCGSRTAPCSTCGRSVMLKDMDIHQVAVHPNN
uniref:Uncharacterized protein n=1 Tax=Kalanchoe fedtschenkoi TaxID=63787 RepID=A0A7N0TVG4_KALFE